MKSYYLSYIISTLFCLNTFGQDNCCYAHQKKFEDFLGIWQWTSSQDTFTIKLIKDSIFLKQRETRLVIVTGWHRFIKDGKVLESSMEYSDTIKNKYTTIVGSKIERNILSFIFNDITRDRSFEVKFELIGVNDSRAVWSSYYLERIRVNEPPPKFKDGQTIPSDIILKKLNLKL